MNKEYENDEMITIVDEEGNEILYEIILTFELEEYNKSYVCVAPMTEEENEEETPLFVFSYVPDETGENGILKEVDDEKEWEACEEVVNAFIEAEDLEADLEDDDDDLK